MKLIIDRFEKEYAVLVPESGAIINVPLSLLSDAQEGDIYELSFCKAETEMRKEKLFKNKKSLFD